MTRKEKFEDYEGFVEKFKPKKTTDDCMTPPTVYNIVRDWACREYGIDPEKIVRPFWPGGDYEHYDYPDGAVVLDNPPFSILTKICGFYLERGIPFFLFAPTLTALGGRRNVMRINHIITDCDIIYENGAMVSTSFVASCGGDIVMQTAPELTRLINAETERLRKAEKVELPKYSYPDNIVTAAMMQRYCRHGIDFRIRRADCVPISKMDAQREKGRAIFGSGLLLSEKAAAEKAEAEKAAAEKAEAEKAEAEKAEAEKEAAKRAAAEKARTIRWELSERELEIIRKLSSQND